MKQNWQKIKKNIPTKVRTGIRKFFAVLWSNDLNDPKNEKIKIHGITNFDSRQIIISDDQSDKEKVYTTWHEFVHGIDHDHEIGLTETQVVKLEQCYPFVREFILTLEGKKK